WSQPAARAFSSSPFIARADGNDRDRLQSGIGLDAPGSLIAIEDGHLDVHQYEVGMLGFSAGDPGLAVGGLQDRIARACRALAGRRLHPDASTARSFWRWQIQAPSPP